MSYGTLLITYLDGTQRMLPLQTNTLRLGSAHDNDIVLSDMGIAPYHAIFQCNEQGDLLIRIVGSPVESGVAESIVEVPYRFAPAIQFQVAGYKLRYVAAESMTAQLKQDLLRASEAHWSAALAGGIDEAGVWRALLD